MKLLLKQSSKHTSMWLRIDVTILLLPLPCLKCVNVLYSKQDTWLFPHMTVLMVRLGRVLFACSFSGIISLT